LELEILVLLTLQSMLLIIEVVEEVVLVLREHQDQVVLV
jgi:hypothetical protein